MAWEEQSGSRQTREQPVVEDGHRRGRRAAEQSPAASGQHHVAREHGLLLRRTPGRKLRVESGGSRVSRALSGVVGTLTQSPVVLC